MNDLINIVGVLGWVALAIAIYLYKKTTNEKKDLLKKKVDSSIYPKVVVIGGGTGQSIFLRGLKHETHNITAVVTVADDGGGSGVLREDLGMLPPGDIRNCILALADIEPTMNEVMRYRFKDGALKGQSFGNLFIAAMNGLYGNFETAVYKMSEIFAITGTVLPVTLQDIKLVANLSNGNIVRGESAIPTEVKLQNTSIDSVYLNPVDVKPLDDVIKAINEADIIVIGPGSLYTSIMPNLLVDGVVDAIMNSSSPKVYISNIMTQPGETDNYNVLNHIDAIFKHTNKNIIDYVIVNNEEISDEVFNPYKEDGSTQVLLDKKQKEQLKNMDIKFIEKDLVEVKNGYIRHDAKVMANIVMNIALGCKYDKGI